MNKLEIQILETELAALKQATQEAIEALRCIKIAVANQDTTMATVNVNRVIELLQLDLDN